MKEFLEYQIYRTKREAQEAEADINQKLKDVMNGNIKHDVSQKAIVMDIDEYGNIYAKYVPLKEAKKLKYRPDRIQKRLKAMRG